ncbi:hypothetical protein [Flavobacterium sp. SLB02]|nr:hypothetical protein [Flavobacterium sp. SLB02]QGK74372.1 hypothetical protein GIY83_09980 [Flavobacterium sp. SLB02]
MSYLIPFGNGKVKKKFNVGLDAAVGKGDCGLYFRIGEAFKITLSII